MEISTLESFIVLAECGNFSRAASLLNTTQPNLSKRISTLENELGFPLFDRDTRKMEMTQAGVSFYRGVVGVLDDLRTCIADARWRHSHEKPVVRVGGNLVNIKIAATIERAVAYAANQGFPFELKANRRYLAASPIEPGTVEPFQGILAGEDSVSVLFASEDVYAPALSVTPLYRDPFAVYVSRESEFAQRESVDLRDLESQLFLKSNSYDTYNERIDEVLAELGMAPRKRVNFYNSMGEMGVRCAPDEVLIVPASIASFIAEPSISGLVRLPVANENAFFQVVAVSAADDDSEYTAMAVDALRVVASSWQDE